MSKHAVRESQDTAPAGCAGLIARITWMMAGNAALAVIAVLILQAGSPSALDVFFWGVVVALLAVRYVDVTRLGGLTADGEPASIGHWRRYALYLVGATAALWTLAHAGGRLASA